MVILMGLVSYLLIKPCIAICYAYLQFRCFTLNQLGTGLGFRVHYFNEHFKNVLEISNERSWKVLEFDMSKWV